MAKRKRDQGFHTKRMKAVQEGSNEQVLLADVRELLLKTKGENVNGAGSGINKDDSQDHTESTFTPPERFSEVEVEISALSSIGDGLGLSSTSDHVYVVPFTLPGDVAKAKIVNQFASDLYTLTDLVSIIKPSHERDDSLIQCQYFAKCSGCQFQMLPYEKQLAHKKTILEKAYRNFSNLAPESIPTIGETIGSPMQYGYRTKITPHFDGPPGSMSRKARKHPEERQGFDKVPPIGFMVKGTRKTMDIEDCPIATDAVRDGLRKERKRVADEISKYKRGATLLLRETTTRTPIERPSPPKEENPPTTNRTDAQSPNHDELAISNEALPTTPIPLTTSPSTTPAYTESKTYITDQNALSTEYIGPYTFRNPAGAFFQNNNSILETFTSHIRSHILPPSPPSSPSPSPSSPSSTPSAVARKPTYLIDTYSGSGLFTITLSPLFTACLGIDISASSIASANLNARLNAVPNATFIAGDSADIFARAREMFSADESVVVVDPPRKGCDGPFLRQLLGWGPRRVVYVSCNVHTQARDVGVLVRGMDQELEEEGGKEEKEGGKEKEEGTEGMMDGQEGIKTTKGRGRRVKYELESLRGFDFFPQTGHVEGVAILQRVDHPKDE